MVFVAMEAEVPWQRRTAHIKSILSSMKPKFNMVRDILLLNKYTKFQLILT